MHLFGFIIGIYHDARSPERQILSEYGCVVRLQPSKNDHSVSLLANTVTNLYRIIITFTFARILNLHSFLPE